MKKTKISCIVPVYNSEKYLSKCINSIIAQTFKDFELILVDDGSVDTSARICNDFAEKYSFIKVIHSRNNGVSSARNKGLDIAIGEYIYFCDSDDWIEPDLFDNAIKSIDSKDILFFDVFEEKKDSQLVKHQKVSDDVIQMQNSLLCGSLMGWLWSCFFKKSIIENIRFNQTISICEDLLFFIEISKKINSIKYLAQPYYHYNQQNEDSACHMFTPNKAYEIVEVIKEIDNILLEVGSKETYVDSILMLKARMKIWILLKCNHLETTFFELFKNDKLYDKQNLSILQRTLLFCCIKPLRFMIYLARLIKKID